MSRKKNAVTFLKPEEPAFLRRLKAEIGFKEGPSVDTKREDLPQCESEDLEDKDDERPTVVALEPGDLTADEADQLKVFEEPEPTVEEGGRILFKKPLKRSAEEKAADAAVQAKAAKIKESTSKKVKDKKLLSFDDEEDDDYS